MFYLIQSMIKNGKVEIGKTPCEDTGKKSTVIKKGRALSDDKDVEDVFDKVAGYMDWDNIPNNLTREAKWVNEKEDKKDA